MSHGDPLIHLSLAEREVSKVPGISEGTPTREINKAVIVGCGTMGSGIAMAFAGSGIPVYINEASQALLDEAYARIQQSYENSRRKGRITQEDVLRRLGLIRPTLDYGIFSEADVAVEAVDENMSLKKQIFRDLGAACRPEAILATNTSSLDIDEIASATPVSSRVVGYHFFAPANVMPLIEIVRGKATAPEVIAASIKLARKLHKTGVVVGNCRGFAGNRMYFQYQREAQFLVEEGARVEEVDAALTHFGMAMGPFAARDLSGLDVAWGIQNRFLEADPQMLRKPLVLDRLCRMGRFGQKTGAGWYRYVAGSHKPLPDPEVQKIIEECAGQAGIARRMFSAEEIVERTLYALINEGARILDEGIVHRAMALDIIFVKGYGFPAHRGGPMWFADEVGLKAVYRRVCDFELRLGAHWRPAPLLKHLAERGSSFADYDK